jgi:hypothetical protein
MSNVFLPGLNNEHRTRLAEAQVPCYDLTLGEDQGLMIEQQHLDAALAALGAYIESQSPSVFEGIATAVLKPKVAALAVEPKYHKVTDDWKGGDNDELVQSVRHFLVPLIDREVQLHTRSGYPCEPVNDGKFHIHLYCSTLAWKEPGVVPPETLFGYPNSNRTRTFLPSGRGITIVDEASEFAVAELIGPNNLYVMWNLQHNYEPNRGRIFRVLMQKLAHVLGLSPEDHRRLMRQRFVEECSKAMVRVVRDTAGDGEQGVPGQGDVVPSTLMPNSRFGAHVPALIPAAGKTAVTVQEHKTRIAALRKQLTTAIAAARAKERKLLTDESVDLDEFGLEYEDLMKVKSVKDVKVERDTIVIFTDVLNCRDERSGVYHEIGAFKIELPMNGNQPRWTNLTRRVTGMKEGMHAPHVWDNGHACLGNTSDIFPKLFLQRQWSIAAQLAIEFVQSANTADAAGKHVNRWPRAVGR